MPVYVDNAKNPYGRMLMCHMLADTIGELLEMADKIGIARRHFQPWSHPHFDLSQSFRARAIAAGAIPVDRRGLVAVKRKQRIRLTEDAGQRLELRLATEASTRGANSPHRAT
jgi:hypothetical protein